MTMKCLECGELDETNTAFCGRCGRSVHRLLSEKEEKKLKNDA